MLGEIPQEEHRKIDSINGLTELGKFDEAAKEWLISSRTKIHH